MGTIYLQKYRNRCDNSTQHQHTQHLIYVNGSYQLVESLEEMLASKTKPMIDDCHFIKAFISSWLSAESLFIGLLFYGNSSKIYYDDKKVLSALRQAHTIQAYFLLPITKAGGPP